ncbi:MAG: MFS transporter [Faecousia sp.]
MAFGKKRLPTPKEEKLPFFKFLAWKSSDVASAASFLIVNTYLMRFCTDFLGMDPAVVGMILLVSNIVDFFTDFLGAIIVDNTNTKWGRGRPYELSIIGVTICTMLLFMTPAGWSQGVKIAWVFFVYTFEFGVFNTMRGAAMNVYCIRAWKNRKVIGKLSSYGGLVTTLGSMVVSVSFPKLMATIATTASGWGRLVAIYLIPLTLIATLRFIFVKEDTSIAADKHEKVNLKTLFEMMKKNKYAWFYAGIIFLFNTITSLGTLSYYWKYIVGDESLSGIISIFGILMLPLMLIFPVILKKHSAAKIVGVCTFISAVGYLLNFFAGANIPFLMGAALISSLAMLPISYLGFLFILDLASYNRHLGLPPMEASVGAIFNGFGTQLGQGVGGWLTGMLLSLAGYVAAEGSQAVQQPESVLTMIRCLHSILPMVLMILIGLCAFGFNKLSKRMPEIEADLAAKDAAAKISE